MGKAGWVSLISALVILLGFFYFTWYLVHVVTVAQQQWDLEQPLFEPDIAV